MRGKDLICLHDLSIDEFAMIMDKAKDLKDKQKRGEGHHELKGKTLGMIFTKSSTRTRVSFEVGMWQLGGYALFLSANDIQLGRGEPIKDTARVLSRYVDGIMIRTFAHSDVIELAKYADIPVINGLTDLLHPCQALTDIFTVMEHKGNPKGLKMAYIGDGNNMVNSLMFAAAKTGIHLSIASPDFYQPKGSLVKLAREDALKTGATIEIVHDPLFAAKDADILYTDVWASMGQEAEQEKRMKDFAGYQINKQIMDAAKPDAIVLHCLPAHRGEEITDEVMEGSQSVVFDQSENRLHVQKAIMALTMA